MTPRVPGAWHPRWARPVPGPAARSHGKNTPKPAMVVGCGSVGSEVVRVLRDHVARWTLVDDGRVTAEVHAVRAAVADASAFRALLDERRPDVVVLSRARTMPA